MNCRTQKLKNAGPLQYMYCKYSQIQTLPFSHLASKCMLYKDKNNKKIIQKTIIIFIILYLNTIQKCLLFTEVKLSLLKC